jgi:hypothetical protein
MQAARDYEGKGSYEKACDQRDAEKFFFSVKAEYVWWRGIWFGLAGVPTPQNGGMPLLVSRLSMAYKIAKKEKA